MKSHLHTALSIWMLGGLIFTSCSSSGLANEPVPTDKPNIIFLMIDDCSAVEFSCYSTDDHPSEVQTPVVDKLAEEGLQFQTCWASPLCMPARAMLLSGKYGAHTGIYGNRLSNGGRNFAGVHIPMSKVLKENGYETAISGKWHLPGNAGEEEYGFDEYSLLGGYFRPFEKPIEWDGLWFSWSAAEKTFYDKAVIGSKRGQYPALYWNGCVVENGELLPSDSSTYAPDLCQDFALDFITREREKPFFLYYPMVLPHDPWNGTPDPELAGGKTEIGFIPLLLRVEYYVDELVKTLKESGLYENTIVFLTADNATLANGKGSCSELGVRVPLIVFGGPVKARGVSDVLVDFTDMYPTVLEAAGIDVSGMDQLDGVSYNPLLKGNAFEGKSFIFSYLDLERTIRTREYMMDGHGGVWKCSPNGNILDYNPMEEGPETQKIREELLGTMEPYKVPDETLFSKERLESARWEHVWPSFHSSTLEAYKNGNDWMNNPRRKGYH